MANSLAAKPGLSDVKLFIHLSLWLSVGFAAASGNMQSLYCIYFLKYRKWQIWKNIRPSCFVAWGGSTGPPRRSLCSCTGWTVGQMWALGEKDFPGIVAKRQLF